MVHTEYQEQTFFRYKREIFFIKTYKSVVLQDTNLWKHSYNKSCENLFCKSNQNK